MRTMFPETGRANHCDTDDASVSNHNPWTLARKIHRCCLTWQAQRHYCERSAIQLVANMPRVMELLYK